MRPTAPRAFLLVRHRDVSGVSGTGAVAEGVEWADGSASLRWRGEHAATTFWEAGIRAVLAVHGHSGGSEVLYVDGAVLRDRAAADFAFPLSTGRRIPTAAVDGICVECDSAWPCVVCPDVVGAAVT